MFYKVSGFADEYSAEFDKQISGFNSLNLDYIELRFVDGANVSTLDKEKIAEVKEKLSAAEISVSAIGSPLGKIKLTDDFEKHLDVAKNVFETAKVLGAKYIRVFSFYLDGKTHKECFDAVTERLSKMLDLADEYGVVLCLENEEGLYGESPESCRELLVHFNGRLKSVFDMGNFLLCGYSPKKAYKLLRDYIEYFHIKDASKDGAIVPCGEGKAQIKSILKQFKKYSDKESVFVSLEPHLVDFVGLNDLAAHNLKKKIAFENDAEAFTYAKENLDKLLKSI